MTCVSQLNWLFNIQLHGGTQNDNTTLGRHLHQ